MRNLASRLLTVLYIILLAIGTTGILFYILGYRYYAITTGSMGEAYPVGTMIVIEPVDISDISKDDVISFVADQESTIVTHRVTRIDGDFLYTKGDANNSEDNNPVYCENIIGRVAFGIPLIGFLVILLNTLPGRIISIALVVALIIRFIVMIVKDKNKKARTADI